MWLLAESEVIPNAIFDIINTGFLAWYAWYTTVKLIPSIIKDNQIATKELMARYDAQVAEITESSELRSAEAASILEEERKKLTSLVSSFESLSDSFEKLAKSYYDK
jgi:hypothetical protein